MNTMKRKENEAITSKWELVQQIAQQLPKLKSSNVEVTITLCQGNIPASGHLW